MAANTTKKAITMINHGPVGSAVGRSQKCSAAPSYHPRMKETEKEKRDGFNSSATPLR